MQKRFTRVAVAFFIGSIMLFQGCKKEDTLGIDNDKIIRTPYSLFAGTDQGWLVKTNDAERYTAVFPSDGYAAAALLTCKTNLLFVKNNVHLSENDGQNFNPVFYKVRRQPWQEMIVNAEQQGRIYITSTEGRGISYSEDTGKTWVRDDNWEENPPPNTEVTSFTVTDDGAVYAFSYKNFVLLKRASAGDAWTTVTTTGMFPPEDAKYFITSSGNNLYLTDYSGKYDVWHSEDGGANWARYFRSLMPYRTHYNTAAAASGGPLLVGTDSFGVFRAEGNMMVPASGGLDQVTSVYRIVVKKNIYKNGAIHEYVFMATNNGIYRSEDKGYNWDKMTFGEFERKYTSLY